jgi:hypothetical protein
MAFTVSDLQDMIQLIEQRPEWKQVLRTVLLTEELLNLPQLVAQLVEIQRQQAQELEAMRSEFRTEIGALRSELEATRSEFRTELARFTTKLGLEIEEEASETLLWVMEQKGWQLVEGPYTLAMNGEVDVVAVFANDQGQRITVLMEVKLRLNRRTVDAWANRVRSEGFLRRLQRHGLTPPYWIYLFGFRIDRTAAKRAEQRQVGVMTARGEMFPPVELP